MWARVEKLECEARSSMEKFEEITRGWSQAKAKVIPQELHQALGRQLQLCAQVLEDKSKLINDLQQVTTVAHTHTHAWSCPQTHTHTHTDKQTQKHRHPHTHTPIIKLINRTAE